MNSVMIVPAIAALFAIANFSATRAPASAHEWYPIECCAGHDCMRANGAVSDRLGNLIVVVGDRRIAIPPEFVARVSPDSQLHICFHSSIDEMDGSALVVPDFLFLPVQS